MITIPSWAAAATLAALLSAFLLAVRWAIRLDKHLALLSQQVNALSTRLATTDGLTAKVDGIAFRLDAAEERVKLGEDGHRRNGRAVGAIRQTVRLLCAKTDVPFVEED